jgi:hypothetical protein
MKAVALVRFLVEQRDRHGKTVFSVTELANVANVSPATINVQLGRLVRQGVVRRWVPGRYGLPEGVTAESLARSIDADAYVTGGFALARHGFITQQPSEIECFTLRRHNRSRRRSTPLGTLVFVCVNSRMHAPPPHGSLAPPDQALCDLVHLLRRHGLDPRSLYTFRGLDRLKIPAAVRARYPRSVQRAVAALVGALPGRRSIGDPDRCRDRQAGDGQSAHGQRVASLLERAPGDADAVRRPQ